MRDAVQQVIREEIAPYLQVGGGPPTLPGMERVARLEAVVEHLDKTISDIKSEMKEMRAEVRADAKATRTTVVVTSIASVFAVLGTLLTLYSMNLSSQANLLSAFQSGLTALETKRPQP